MALVMSMFGWVDVASADPVAPPAVPVAADVPNAVAGVEPTGTGVVRPDAVSASVTARASGQRVEVLSERTEFARSWALPAGGFEAEAVAAPVRFQDSKAGNDGWRDIDTTLKVNADGTLSPKAVPGDLVFGGQGDPAKDLISNADTDGQDLSLGSGISAVLPAPVLDGATATYPDVLPGVDVTVEARPTGFEQLWVAKTRAGLDALLSEQTGGDQGLSASLNLEEVSATSRADGGVTFTDTDDKVIGRLIAPTVWDAETTTTGEPADVADADFTVVEDGDVVPPSNDATGELELSLVPNQDWLEDPDRVFPVTIDPTYVAATAGAVFDTYVQDGVTGDASASATMPVGMASNGKQSRSFLNFSTAAVKDKKIMSASLQLWATESGTCTANGWSSYEAGLSTTATRWTAQPTISTKYATSTQTKGFGTGCPDGSVSIDMKTQMQSWADGAATTRGMVLKADNETSYTYYHRFNSSQAGSQQPLLHYTYNRTPVVPVSPAASPVVMFTPTGASDSRPYTSSTTPSVSTVVSDPDGNTVRGEFYVYTTATAITGHISSCGSGFVASGTTATCTLTPALPADGVFYLRGRANDGVTGYSSMSAPKTIYVAAAAPAAPVVTCPAPYTNGSWQASAPAADVTCTITAAGTGYSAPSRIRFAVDGNPTYTVANIPQSSSTAVAKTTVTIPKTAGGHSIHALATSPTGKQGATSYFAGWGNNPLLKRPGVAPRITTVDTVEMNAAGPAQTGGTAATATTQWRMSGATGVAGWVDAPATNTMTVTQTGNQSQAAGVFDTTSIIGLADGSSLTVNGRVPTLVDVRVCITLATGMQCSGQSTVLRVPHAFGDGFPVADAGPGQVALWTGELQVDDSDASLATPDGALSVSRSHSSFASTPAAQNAVFGPGWAASFDGDDSGAGGSELYDGTDQDGTLAVVDADGEALVFTTPSKARRSTTTIPTGAYLPADKDTQTAGSTLTVSGSGAATVAELKSDDGVITKFQVIAAPTTDSATFQTVEIREPAVPGKTTYSYDTEGRVTAITGALPDGVTTCSPGTKTAGCRVLRISYATTTTATATTPGDYQGRVKSITAQVNTDTDRQLAGYTYDAAGRMVQATDSRTNLTTGYTWTGSGATLRLATVTPAGQAPFTFGYDTAANKLAQVTRPNPATAGGGTAQLAAYIYQIPTSAAAGLPDMPAVTGKWLQAKTPTWGAAVFGPDRPVTGITPAAVSNADWWKQADLQFTDAEGYTVNTASYGAGDWQYTAADYDTTGNTIRAFDDRGTRAILDQDITPAATDQYATLAVYNNDIKDDTDTVITPAGTLVTDTYTPAHQVTAADGTVKSLRTHTTTSYDQDAPNAGINPTSGQPYRLPTTTATTAETVDRDVDETLSTSFTGYGALETGDKTGWELGQATSSTTDMDGSATVNAGDITTTTRYDDRGRIIENRQPASNGTDAGTRATVYYTGDTSSVSGCGSKPAWAGQVCQVGPVAQPTGQTMPVSTTTGYTWDLQTSTETDTSGSVTSTTTTSYNAQDRPTTVTTAVSGLASSQAVPAVTTSYDTATGEVTGTTSIAGSTASTYDAWGRQLTYTNTPTAQTADSSTTTYDPAGRTTSVADNNGQTSYVYDGTDAAGKEERRGQVTAVKVKITGGIEYTSTGAYDAGGDLTLEKLPGNIIRRTTIDTTGDQTGLTINGQGIDPATGLSAPDQPWVGWTTQSNAQSQITDEYTPTADGDTTTTSGLHYSYDQAGRLSAVQDRTTAADPSTGISSCLTRSYSFNSNGSRTGQAAAPAAANGDCSTTDAATTSRAYDAADRPTSGGNGTGSYVYDPLGRQTSIPAADAPKLGHGNISLAYYDTDNIRTINQGTLGAGGTQTSYTLDSSSRRLNQTTQTDTGTSTLLRHYADSSDNPTWAVDTTAGVTTTTRYNELINGDLGLTFTTTNGSTKAELDIPTPRGDTATTITLSNSMTGPDQTPANSIDTWTSYTEYGQPNQTPTTTPGGTTGIGYGWLGAKQRATLGTGLTLMGARLYNLTTALFTTSDPVFGGNVTDLSYPPDPINSSDISGMYCYAGVGTTCTRFITDLNGTTIPVRSNVRNKVLKKHRISWDTAKWLMRRLILVRTEGNGDVIYERRIYQYVCNSKGRNCHKTGQSVVVRAVVNFRRGDDGKTIGMKTMYCVTGQNECPSWINGRKKY